jgi:hypothetical protein
MGMLKIASYVVICFLVLAVQRVQACDDPKSCLEISATYCANPWDGNEGPNWGAAAYQADQEALRQCYPYQIKRITDYKYEDYKGCRTGFFGSKASAQYQCASAGTPNMGTWDGACGVRASYQCRRHPKFGELCACFPNRR